MKKLLLVLFMGVLLLPNINAESIDTEESKEVDAGMTPDSPFYFLEKAMENLDITFTFNKGKKTEKLLEYAKERLAEAEEMTESEKEKYVEELVEEYLSNLDEASDNLIELDEEESEELEADLDETISKSDELSEKLNVDLAEKLEEMKGAAYIKFAVLKDTLLNENQEALIEKANEAGYGLGELSKMAVGAGILELTLEEVLDGVIEVGSVEEYFKQNDIEMYELVIKGIEYKREILQERLVKAIENANERAINRIEAQLERSVNVEAKQVIRDQFMARRDEIFAEYNVESFEELEEEVRKQVLDELQTLRQSTREELRTMIQEKVARFETAMNELQTNGTIGDKLDYLEETLSEDVHNDLKNRIQERINQIRGKENN